MVQACDGTKEQLELQLDHLDQLPMLRQERQLAGAACAVGLQLLTGPYVAHRLFCIARSKHQQAQQQADKNRYGRVEEHCRHCYSQHQRQVLKF